MKSLVLATLPHTNTLPAYHDSYVSIGDGLEVLIPADAKSGDKWKITVSPFRTAKPVASSIQGNGVFITSSQELLSSIEGNIVITPNDTQQVFNLPNQPPTSVRDHRSNMLVSFFNHLFLVKGKTLWWTDLDNTWDWHPHPHGEADFRTVEWETHDCTGLVRSADKLYMHFPSAIYEITYIGKPTVIMLAAKVHGIGCVMANTLVVHNTTQFFLGTDNFYAWSSDSGLNIIGQDVWKKFITLCPDVSQVWSYIDQRNNEICWVSGEHVWAFNFVERHWQKYSTDGVLGHSTVGWTSHHPKLDESLTIIEPVKNNGLENVWVTENTICREQREFDKLEKCLPMSSPFLETNDQTYGDLHFQKRTDLVMLDMQTEFPWIGVKIFVSGRHFVSHADNWVDCGVWRQDYQGKQIDFPAVVGKVLKFRFVLLDGFDLTGVKLNGGLSLNGKRLDIANGEIIMNGSREDFLGRQMVLLDGTRTLGELNVFEKLNKAELRAWGERVDLPQVLIGPDK